MTCNTSASNRNTSVNLLRSKFYVCPACGSITHAAASASISCCGLALTAPEAGEIDSAHRLSIENVEDEQFIRIHHDMTKDHYISFLAFVASDREQTVKLYPEGNAETRLQLRGRGYLYLYCSKHGLMKQKV